MSTEKRLLQAVQSQPPDVAALCQLLEESSDGAAWVDQEGRTLLHQAVSSGTACDQFQKVIKVLVSHPRLDLAQRNIDGRTALDICMQERTPAALMAAHVITDHVSALLLEGATEQVEALVMAGWNTWPVQRIPQLEQLPDAGLYLKAVLKMETKCQDIHQLIHEGDLKHLKQELDHKQLAVIRDATGMTPLHKAVLFQHPEIIQYLLDNFQLDVNLQDNIGRSALHYASVLDDNHNIYNLLKAQQGDETLKDTKGQTPKYYHDNPEELDISKIREFTDLLLRLPQFDAKLRSIHDAIASDSLKTVKQLLDRKQLVTMKDGSGLTPVHKAVLYRKQDIARYMIDNFPEAANATDNWGRTPLHYAAAYDTELCELLKQRNCDVNVTDMYGRKADYYAEHMEEINAEKMQSDAEHFAKVAAFQQRVSECHNAASTGNLQRLKDLLDRKQIVLAKDGTGMTLIHKAVIYEQIKVIEYIIDKFPQALGSTDHMGRTALHLAGALPDKGLVYSLIANKATQPVIDMKDLFGHRADFYKDHPSVLVIEDIKDRIEQHMAQSPTKVIMPRTPQTPPKRPASDVKPYKTAVLSTDLQEDPFIKKNVPYPTTPDAAYCAKMLGPILATAIAEVAEIRPHDPIEFLAHYLYKHDADKQRKIEEAAMLESQRLAEVEKQRENEELRARRREQRELEAEERAQEAVRQAEEKRAREEEEKRIARSKLPTLKEEDEISHGKDKHGRTRLHLAAATKGVDITILLREGLDITERDDKGKTPRDYAMEDKIKENIHALDDHVIKMLRDEEKDGILKLVLNGYYDQMPEVDKALEEQLSEEIRETLQRLPKIQETLSAIFSACAKGNLKQVRQSLDRKMYVLARDASGHTPLHIATIHGNRGVIEYLVNTYPHCINALDSLHKTALHHAAATSGDLATFLQEHGADATLTDVEHKMPSDYAAKLNHKTTERGDTDGQEIQENEEEEK